MDYNGFKEEILRLTGVDLHAYKENQMKRRIDAWIVKNNCKDYRAYCMLLQLDEEKREAFLSYITINVSEFFRNPNQWVILEKEILPNLLASNKPLKIWSAACSSGDEPYSLAMLLAKYIPLSRIHILATDIDKEILQKAKEGIYLERHVAGIPEAYRQQYLTQVGNTYHISPGLKKCIQFKKHDLLKDPYPRDIDLIICRNVLIYFTEESKHGIYTKFSQALSSDGVLFVGSTEQIMGASQYDLAPHQLFFYKKIKPQD